MINKIEYLCLAQRTLNSVIKQVSVLKPGYLSWLYHVYCITKAQGQDTSVL